MGWVNNAEKDRKRQGVGVGKMEGSRWKKVWLKCTQDESSPSTSQIFTASLKSCISRCFLAVPSQPVTKHILPSLPVIYQSSILPACIVILFQKQQKYQYPMLQTQPLESIFKDPSFAWQLLESQILIETVQQPQGQDISNLLQLYMRGVEVMNTCLDPRESYFRSKVTALMAKNTVRKTFKSKQELEEVKKAEPKQEEPKQQTKKVAKKETSKKSAQGFVSASALQQKKKQLELRLAYATEQHNPQGLRKIIAQNKEAQIKLVTKVQKIMQSHEQKLNQRINRRKLKTATYRSKTEDQVETMQSLDQDSTNNVNVPINIVQPKLNSIPQIISEAPGKQSQRKLYKSADAKQKTSKDNSQRKEDSKEPPVRDRRLSVNLLHLC